MTGGREFGIAVCSTDGCISTTLEVTFEGPIGLDDLETPFVLPGQEGSPLCIFCTLTAVEKNC